MHEEGNQMKPYRVHCGPRRVM